MPGLKPGSMLSGRYRLAEVLGRGSRSTVYRAVDELLGREVAVKVSRGRPGDVEQLRRHEAEAKILAGLSHHALVTLLDVGADQGDEDNRHTYLVMELILGADLRANARNGPVSPAHMALIGHDLADGLSHIHHRGIVHRDIKPANILLVDYRNGDGRPRAKLTDFGVATTVGQDRVVGEGGTSGTPAYLSPEQVAEEPVGPSSDVYSLGLVLLEGLTGAMVYPGAPLESALARLFRAPRVPESLPPQWRELLEAMLRRNPADRPSARDVSLALRQEVILGSVRHRAGSLLEPVEEEGRMAAVRRQAILDTPEDGAFDRITALAARIFSVPVAIISIVDTDRIWFKSRVGTDVRQIGRDPGLCASAILQREAWIVRDAPRDPRTLTNPLVAGEFGLQFYAGVPLETSDGYNLGTLCVLDTRARDFGPGDVATLKDLAAIVMDDLEMRLHSRRAAPELLGAGG